MEEIRSIFNRFRDNPGSVSNDDLIKLSQYFADKAGVVDLEEEDVDLVEEYKVFSEDPEARRRMQELALEAEEGKLKEDVVRSLATALSLVDFGISQGQISKFKSEEAALEEPTLRQDFTPSSDLQRAIERVEARIARGGADPREELARQDITDAFNADINAARTASQGQAGALGALSQTAVNRRRRGALELAALRQGLLRQDEELLGNLLRTQSEEARTGEIARSNIDRIRFAQANRQQDAVGALGAQGRFNQRVALGRIGAALSEQIPATVTAFSREDIPDTEPTTASAGLFDTRIPSFVVRDPTRIRTFEGINGTEDFVGFEDNINRSLTRPGLR